MSTISSIPMRITELRADLGHRRSARKAHRDLTRELAAYSSPSDRLELSAILDRHSSENSAEVGEIRQILFELAAS